MKQLTPQRSKWKLWLILFGVWTLVGLSFSCISYLTAISENSQVSFWKVFEKNMLRFYLWGALSPVIFQVARRFNFERGERWLKNALVHIPLGLFFSAVHSIIFAVLIWLLEDPLRERPFFQFFREYISTGNFYTAILLYSLIVVSIHALLFYRNYQAGEAREALLKAELTQARLQALKMQLNPHFLFNTLHSISSLVLNDPPKAHEMIARLGDFLRITLEHSEDQMVTLGRELEFLRSYLEIEQTRFQDWLTVDFEIDPATLAAIVPHLILQPVVENAVRHGIAPLTGLGNITIASRISGDFLLLEVRDNGTGMSENGNSNGMSQTGKGKGLENVRARLKQIYGEAYGFEMKNGSKGGLTVTLKLPFSLAESEDSQICRVI